MGFLGCCNGDHNLKRVYMVSLTCSETHAKCQSVTAIYAFAVMSMMNCVSEDAVAPGD